MGGRGGSSTLNNSKTSVGICDFPAEKYQIL